MLSYRPFHPIAWVLFLTSCAPPGSSASPADGNGPHSVDTRSDSSVELIADGRTDTYPLIARILGGTPIESPDCGHADFGPHITQAFDSTLRKSVFVFHIHVSHDTDRCRNFDRQRNEIKTYGPSPGYTKAFENDRTTYRWRFRLDPTFQPSERFTHIHQLKAGDGDAGAPIITLTPRRSSPDALELIHVDSHGSSTKVATTDLTPFKGVWIEAYETATWSANGEYSLELRRLSDGVELFSYRSSDIDMWRAGTTFARPKWGIYRSLDRLEQLRDEQVRFDRICLAKGNDDCAAD